MAGKMQLAAKCLLGTTLLASGTGGVYYATSHGWCAPGHQGAKEAAASDLDAVASAWSEPPSAHTAENAQSSPIARSANPALPDADKPAVKPAAEDRYSAPVDTPTEAAVVKHDTAKD